MQAVPDPAAVLGASQVRDYRDNGFLFPLRALEPAEAAEALRRTEAVEQARAGRLPPTLNVKAHLLMPWLWDLVHDPRIVRPVQDLLGPDLLCWGSSFFNKNANDAKYVAWHQDATYWGLDDLRALTAWVAFTPSRRDNGCMRVVPGSHLAPQPHVIERDPDNMLMVAGERLLQTPDEADTVAMELDAGEMSLHHMLLSHGSEANRSGVRRVGFAIRYIAADMRQVGGERGTATRVAGRDPGHFDLEQRPEGDFHPEAMRRHTEVFRRWMGFIRRQVQAGQP